MELGQKAKAFRVLLLPYLVVTRRQDGLIKYQIAMYNDSSRKHRCFLSQI